MSQTVCVYRQGDLSDELILTSGMTDPVTFMLFNGRQKVDLTGATISVSLLDMERQHSGEDFGPFGSIDNGDENDTTDAPTLEVSHESVSVSTQTTNKGECVWTPVTADVDTPRPYHYQLKVTIAGAVSFYPANIEKGRAYIYPGV